ncbi:B12-binding domain-containing radical SAM protein [Patescibacteria group bacterium]|nr:B12-binding domain-containing radical SAM protein [Patescibacteria group bacterium]
MLQQSGHEVLIYDGDHDPCGFSPSMQATALSHHHYLNGLRDDSHKLWQEYLYILDDFKPDVVGISFLTVKVASALMIAQLTKQHNPKIKVIAGGEHVTSRPQDALGKNVDYIVCGEGEQGITFLIQQISEGGSPERIIRSLLIETLDMIPLPALDCLHTKTYRPLDMGLMISARGCPWPCRFCALRPIWGCKVRYHSVTRVVKEVNLRKQIYGTDYFSFRNGTFTHNRQRVVNLCQAFYTRQLEILWECLTRAGTFDDPLLARMKDGGCNRIRMGIESGSARILEYIKKGITLAQIRESAEILHRSGIP